jgi:hypothetical protein
MEQMHRQTLDVVGAYLYQDYPDDAVPLLVTLDSDVAHVCGLDPNQSYRIRKYLYGLPDAGKAYFEAYRDHLTANGYTQAKADPCLFTKLTATERTYIVIHVDDTFIASSTSQAINNFKDVLQQKFKITSNDNADSYLGIHLETLPNGSVKLTQPKLLKQLFSEYPATLSSVTVRSPMPPLQSSRFIDETPCEPGKYLRLLGMLMYLTRSRPDIMTAVSYAATRSTNPIMDNYHCLLQCVDYLRNTPDDGHILQLNRFDPLTLYCYVDASYLSHPDSKSHTGYVLSFGTGSFFSKSAKQTLVATSSTHAEARALYTLLTDVHYVLALCTDLGRPIKLPVNVYEDNNSVIQLCDDAHIKKSKHYLMLLNYIKEQIQSGTIQLLYVATEENPADTLSKPLQGRDFDHKTSRIMGPQYRY